MTEGSAEAARLQGYGSYTNPPRFHDEAVQLTDKCLPYATFRSLPINKGRWLHRLPDD